MRERGHLSERKFVQNVTLQKRRGGQWWIDDRQTQKQKGSIYEAYGGGQLNVSPPSSTALSKQLFCSAITILL